MSVEDPTQLAGPGLDAAETEKLDRFALVSVVLGLIGLLPPRWLNISGAHTFGPIAFTAIVSIVAVLLGLIAILRSKELQQPKARTYGALGMALGIFRVLVYPMAGIV